MAKKSSGSNKRKAKVDPIGQAHISSSFNNIIISLTDASGNVISWASAGKMGFRGSKKNTPYAAQVAASSCGREAYDRGLRTIEVFVKGTGSGRDAAIRALAALGMNVTMIRDITPLPHNGCRPPKKRRV